MKLMTLAKDDGTALAAVDGDAAVELSAALPGAPCDIGALLRDGVATRDDLDEVTRSGPRLPLASVTPALPVLQPGKVVCLGLNYIDHAKEGGYEVPDYPALFLRVNTSLVPAGAPVVRPRCSEKFDYEAELIAIIGTRCRHVSEAEALDHVFGYTIFNDVSVRDYQRKTHQWTPGKNFDATGPVGPVVVTADELPPGAAGLRIRSILNGTVLQDANTSDMIFSTARTIAILSEVMTLEPGDLIALGTPQGVGHARRPPLWMKPGDEIVIEIEGIGRLVNPVVDEEELPQIRSLQAAPA